MTIQNINIGASIGDPAADPNRTAWSKAKSNFDDLYFANVTTYGAVGDGTTDDTAAFVAAAAASRHIYLPEGTYAIQATLTQSNLLISGPGTITHISGAAATTYALQLNGTDCTIDGVRFTGNLRLHFSHRTQLRNLRIDANTFNYGVLVWYSDFVSVIGCDVVNAEEANLRCEQRNNSALRLTSNRFSESAGNGVELETITVGTGAGGTNIGQTITGNIFASNAEYGLWMAKTHDHVVVGNFFERNVIGGIYNLVPIDTVIQGNLFEYNTLSGPLDNTKGAIVCVLDNNAPWGVTASPLSICGNYFQGEESSINIIGGGAYQYHVKLSGNMHSRPGGGVAVRIENYDSASWFDITNETFNFGAGNLGYGIRLRNLTTVMDGRKVRIAGCMTNAYACGVNLQRLTDVAIHGCNFINSSHVSLGAIELNNSATADVRVNRFFGNTTNIVASGGSSYVAFGNAGLADT